MKLGLQAFFARLMVRRMENNQNKVVSAIAFAYFCHIYAAVDALAMEYRGTVGRV